mgnify:CR=1 FL=1
MGAATPCFLEFFVEFLAVELYVKSVGMSDDG